jgi:hypothetical protein
MIALKFDDRGLAVNLSQARPVIGMQLQKWMTRVLAHLHAAVNRNIASGGLIGRRSGTLSRALMELVTVTDGGIVGELWPDPAKAPYGGIQEDGGTITPKKGTMLTIPLAAMLTGNGVARGTARQVKDNPTSFGFQSSFIPKGKHVIMGVIADARFAGTRGNGGRGAAIPLFALVPSVTLPGRHYLATTLIQEWQWIADELETITNETVSVLFGEGAFAS